MNRTENAELPIEESILKSAHPEARNEDAIGASPWRLPNGKSLPEFALDRGFAAHGAVAGTRKHEVSSAWRIWTLLGATGREDEVGDRADRHGREDH